MRVRNFGGDGWPGRFEKMFDWVVALDAFDYNDRKPLAELIATEPVPEELRPAIAKIISGERKPNLRAAAKLKVQASERMMIAAYISACLMLVDTMKYDALDDRPYGQSGVHMFGDRFGKEPIEITRELEQDAKKAIELGAELAGVSVETIENMLRDLRAKMEAYPNV